MKWFEGSIPSAIQAAKDKHAIFVVYISGKDDISKQMDDTWSNSDVTQISEQNNIVALRLEANSEVCGQFSMIYPVVCVPCTFFIGENGVPLEVTGGHLESAAFVEKIQQVLQLHSSQKAGQAVSPLISKEQTSSTAGSQENQETSSPQQSEGATAAAPQAGTSDQASTSSQPSLDEKVAKANELLRAKREEKARKEVEDLKRKEIERRNLGKGVAKLQQFKEEQARNEMVNEWKKEKDEKIKDRERVRQQLARDREEKNARFRAEREERERLSQEAKRAKLEEEAEANARTEASKMEKARIQFRLPDGASITNQFSSADTLQNARDFLTEKIGNSFGHFSLSTHYPKRDFTDSDASKSLLDLQLAPSAVVIVLPGSSSVISRPAPSSDGGGLVSMLLAPFLALWNFLYFLLFGSATSPGGSSGGPSQPSQQGAAPSRQTNPRDAPSSSQGTRPKTGYGLRSRQEGNITRLSALRDDDDEDRTTWNGNSTQQM